ncbi:aldo/keto reductase [Ilumatobacter coccineus]|uniref:Putative oxidoreductase n=1 Tax=Ilumatobacter coccineus (strain NBRC 103263 / KCTC 29153 / YM16-304) TaxID=1313172 RepID=A0A6C7EBS0_ILUCY|nr:aldo/keto reductase [Ilumatobacter coccineus]BAN03763.1 putative oxidoreductase [Ilumatobacter coccineus YM16-304]
MHHVKFGRTGMRVSKLCLGTMTFGTQCDEATSFDILDTAFDAGITFVDTADMYPNGQDGELAGLTEEIIGRWMAERGNRENVILASKFWAPMGPNPWNRGASRKHVVGALDASLRRLQTDYLDLFQIHFFDSDTPIDETLRALDDMVRAGKVRYIGCSNFAAWQLAKAIGRSEALGISRYESVQPRYNLLFRDIERELLPLCRHDDVAVMVYNPIAGGLLSGKHQPSTGPTEGTRFTLGSASKRYQERYWADDKFEVVDAIRPLAADAGISMAQMALGWVLANPDVTVPIVGASSSAQLADAVAAEANPLDADLVERLSELTRHYRAVDAAR